MMEFIGISLIDWVGHIATVFVLVSFMFSNIRIVRMINCVGCVLFLMYGLWLSLSPIVIINMLLIIINIYKLYTERIPVA